MALTLRRFHVAESLRDSEKPRLCRGVSLGETDLREKLTAGADW